MNYKTESGAIIQYLGEEYDQQNVLNYSTKPEKALVKSWLHFQMSGQGPMYGQLAWFTRFRPDNIPSAVERYRAEVRRVLGVVEAHLNKTGQDYLVGDKATIADLAFLPWNHALPWMLEDEFGWQDEFPGCFAWHGRLLAREKVGKVLGSKR